MSELLSNYDLNYKLPITNGIFILVLISYSLPFLLSPTNVDKFLICKSDLNLFIPSLDWINFILSRFVFFDFKNYFFTLVLITVFRIFERIYGSKKFLNYIFANFIVSTLFELCIVNLLNHFFENLNITHLANGCFSFIFALFINYCKDIPKEKFDFFGIGFSEKLFFYFFGIQMLFTSYSVLVASISGILAGLICRSNAFNVCDVIRLPDRFANFTIKCLNLILLSNNSPKESILNGATQSYRREQYIELYEQNLLNDQLNLMRQSTTASSASSVSSQASSSAINEEELEQNIKKLQEMGFVRDKAKQILQNTNNDLSRATNLLLEDNNA